MCAQFNNMHWPAILLIVITASSFPVSICSPGVKKWCSFIDAVFYSENPFWKKPFYLYIFSVPRLRLSCPLFFVLAKGVPYLSLLANCCYLALIIDEIPASCLIRNCCYKKYVSCGILYKREKQFTVLSRLRVNAFELAFLLINSFVYIRC